MKARKSLALWRNALVLALAAAAVAFIAKTPALEAQGRSDLEARHQRLLPLFETNGVVFTDADETSGRLVVGVLDRRSEGQVRGRLRALGVDSQAVDVVETEPIFALATLRDRSDDIVGGLQIRFSQYLCSLGFPAQERRARLRHRLSLQRQPGCRGRNHVLPAVGPGAERFHRDRDRGSALRARRRRVPERKKVPSVGRELQPSAGARARLRSARSLEPSGLGSLEIDSAHPTFTITAEGESAQVTTGHKVGRTTGWTRGRSANVREHRRPGSTIVLLCQTFVNATGVIVAGRRQRFTVFVDPGRQRDAPGRPLGGNQSGTQFVYSPIANIRASSATRPGHLN